MVIWLAPILTAVVVSLAEWLHARRSRKMAFLAFGAPARPRTWVRIVPFMRVAALTALCWGFLYLWQADGSAWKSKQDLKRLQQGVHHLVIALDVSPSMQIKDAGPRRDLTRADRARDVMRSVLERLNLQQTRVSVVAFYSAARPVVVDTRDANVIDNILDDLPLEHAFQPGKTNLFQGVVAAGKIGKEWRPKTSTLIVVSDGDTLPAEKTPILPRSFAGTLIVGVGDAHRGTPIDGHSSRQDATSLRRLALQLRGNYWDANARHVRTDTLDRLVAALPTTPARSAELKDWAIGALLIGSSILALLSPILALAGASSAAHGSQRHTVSVKRVLSSCLET